MKINCHYCGIEFDRDANQIKKRKRSFCSRACSGKWRSENLLGINNPTYSKVEVDCAYCGNSLNVTKHKIKLYKNHFCGSLCHDKWRSENTTGKKHHQWGSIELKCEYCGSKVYKNRYKTKTYKKAFCGSDCYNAFRKAALVNCTQCGIEIKVSPVKLKRNEHQFCGRNCYSEWRSINISGEKNPRWKGGASYESYCPIFFDKYFKSEIKERDDNKCQNPDCWNNTDRLSIHHIDYDKNSCHPNNLITLCTSCNSRANKDREWHTAYYKAIMHKRDKLILNVA